VIEQDQSLHADSPGGDDAPTITPTLGDPSLELYSHGWTPTRKPAGNADSYTARETPTPTRVDIAHQSLMRPGRRPRERGTRG
jgi:hypothetical protein